ncbi:uncharacterized protein F4812DRAFT_466542 [Daldinia caldariorum]|uniref:uncharacterized protein n=1 Tax=Daldinia caldariorum TaxID=326644 RepID=UPI00200883AE|nr:uncharacterized protein F4812DRAFT_466542 [Daldinia caldariorum]KAI1465063.1 hypothetical protein F4812DRAFT_466542 [Daldinia caldariorum]
MSSIQPNSNTPNLTYSRGTTSKSYPEKDGTLASSPAKTEKPLAASQLLLDAFKDVRQLVRLIQCQVCSKILREPTTLPCGHSLCKLCVPQTHIRPNISWPATANRLRGFECPFDDCKKEHALGDCAVDITLNKVLTTIQSIMELDRGVTGLSHVSTSITVQDHWDIAGIPSLANKTDEPSILKGARIVATYTLAEQGKLDYGSEVSYYSIGVGDDEAEQIDTTMLARLKESVRPEMDCQVCYALFLDPLTTTCGHTFCRSCLHRILDHSDLCAICRRPLSIQAQVNRQSYPSNDRLCKMINGFWADLVDLRAQTYALEQQANQDGFDIPLFVCTLSYPRMPTFLHVFEPRYRLMIRRVMEGNRTFGMVLANPSRAPGEPEFLEIGTLLRIVNIESFADGRSLIETVGVSRFRVTRHGWLDGYIVGNIEKIDDISVAEEEAIEAEETMRSCGVRELATAPPSPEPSHPEHAVPIRSRPVLISLDDIETMSTRELVEVGVDFARRVRAQSVAWLNSRILSIYGECPADPTLFPWWLASILPVNEEEKYKLLGTLSVGTGNVSVAEEVAEVQKLLAASGLTYTMHSAGTTVEGSWDEVMKVIGQAHSVVHSKGVVRVQSSMRVGTRTDKKQTAADKVKRVEDLLAKQAPSS